MPSTRIHRVDDRIIVPIAVAAGVVAALGPAEPTGSRLPDIVLVTVSVGLVTWAGATARWWALLVLAVVATTIANTLPLAAIGVLAVVAAVWIGTRRRDLPMARASVAAVAVNVAIRSELDGFLGLSALAAVSASAVVLGSGLRRRRSDVRRTATLALSLTGAAVLLAVVGIAVAAGGVGDDLRDANRFAQEGISLLDEGEYADAAARFDQAAQAFSSIDGRLGAVWAQPSGWVPVVAQQRSAAADLSASAAEASADLAAALRVVDPEQLRLVDGRFDLDAIRLIEQPFTAVQTSLGELRTAVGRASSPWLLPPIRDRLVELDADLARNVSKIDNAVEAVRLAPNMLGAEGARRYFVAFTTPAETRGTGGFMGNWAVLSASEGRLRLAEFGRTRELNDGGTRPRHVTGPADWIAEWGRFGFTNGPDGGTDETPWSRITVSPVFPSTAQVVQELLPQSGGRQVDGVFAVDPHVLEALLRFTGPISVEGSDVRLDQSNVLRFLLIDQYELDDNSERVDLLEEVSIETFTRVLGGSLPNPTVVARELGPLVAQGRLVGWASDDAEQALFESVGLASSLPPLDGGDGIAAVFNNAGPNKIDVYLERELTYSATVDEFTGTVSATLELVLSNTADPDGLPDSVVSNYTGDARGTNRTLLSLYSALPMRSATVDGERIVMREGNEAGWVVNSTFLAIPPDGSITVTAEYGGKLGLPTGYRLAVRPQPMVQPEEQTLEVMSVDGSTLVSTRGVADRPAELPVDGAPLDD